MISVIDYGAGNLSSVVNALKFLNIENVVTDNIDKIRASSAIILPGVGAFSDAMQSLQERSLIPVLKEQATQKPFLGICLGMQLLFEKGYEFSECEGLGLICGEIKKIPECGLNIPHMGWNSLVFENPCALLEGMEEGAYVYFVHSFMAYTDFSNVNAYCEYGVKIPALVSRGNIYGAQFHPEKSSETGLKMLKNFTNLVKE